jgi:hypothetical protein
VCQVVNSAVFLAVPNVSTDSKELLAYPNPVNDRVNLQLPERGEYLLSLRGIDGRLILMKKVVTKELDQSVEILIPDLSPGYYTILAQQEGAVALYAKIMVTN